jgi:uncharacterized damage-inducible protein DinB
MAALFQFENYLNQLVLELESFPSEESIWQVPAGIANSPGNLALHITGNLNHFIGAILGKTGYIRERELEFSRKNVARKDLIAGLRDAQSVVVRVLSPLSSEDKLADYPENFKGRTLSIDDALAHLLAHLAYHTGQVNYLRRMLFAA